MHEIIMSWFPVTLWHQATITSAWMVSGGLMLLGLIGCIMPVLPGHILIFLGAVTLRWMLGVSSGLEWWSFVILSLLLIVSQVFETMSGAMGAKWFGGSKWGAWGALIGGLIGMFFFPIGLFLGPLLGALLFEKLFAKQKSMSAVKSGVGSAVGALAGISVKIAVGVAMIAWTVCDALWLGK